MKRDFFVMDRVFSRSLEPAVTEDFGTYSSRRRTKEL